jgi:phosphoglycolate phosphatase
MRSAVIFDLDGTLWDSSEQVVQIWNQVFERRDIPMRLIREDMGQFMGKTTEEIGRMLFPEETDEYQKQVMDACGVEEIIYLSKYGAVLYDGLEETLRILEKDYDLYIVSNCQDGYVDAFLEAHQLRHFFKDIEMSGRTGKAKGDNIRLIIERNHIEKGVYVGDTQGDEKAARFAQIPFIYAGYGFGKAMDPDAVIDRITELPDILVRISKKR